MRLCFAGNALVPLITPALEHSACSPSPHPALTVCLWDNRSTGLADRPVPFLSLDEPLAHDSTDRDDASDVYTSLRKETGIIHMLCSTTGLFFIPDASKTPYNEKASPLKPILNWFMARMGCQVVHAAAVGTDNAGVLITGQGGSGKSTTALACLSSGMNYIGDDSVLIDSRKDTRVYSLYNSAKLEASHSKNFSGFNCSVNKTTCSDTEKILLMLKKDYGEHLVDTLPIKAILLPVVTGSSGTRLRKTNPARCLKALAPTTIFTLPGAGKETFSYLSRFVRKVPGYILELGTDLSQIPDVITGLLSGKKNYEI